MTGNWAPGNTPAPRTQSAGSVRTVSRYSWLLLLAIVLLGAWLCTLNIFGWDGGTGQHPDERFMADVASRLKMPASLGEYLDSRRNPLNPRNVDKTFYVYGLLPQTLTHLTAVMLTPDAALPPTVAPPSPEHYGSNPPIPNPDLGFPKLAVLQWLVNPAGQNLTDYQQVFKVGRAWSAAFALLGIVAIFLIGRRVYGARVGLLAALLLSLAVLPIQIAHFFTVDSATAFFTLLSIYWAVRLAQDGGFGSAIGLGLSIGAAMACRVTMAVLALLAAVAVTQRWWSERNVEAPEADAESSRGVRIGRELSLLGGATMVALAVALALVTFRLLQPDAFVGTSLFDVRLDPRFVQNLREVGALVSGQVDAPPSQQWAGRTPYLFALQNIVAWGMGPLLGLAAWAGWAVAGVQMARAMWAGWRHGERARTSLAHLLPWLWVAVYFAWQGGQLVMTMRYYLPLYGLLALFAAWGLLEIADFRFQISDWVLSKSTIYNLQSAIRWVPLILVIVGTFGWAYAFTRIYTRPHSRIAASQWIYEHVPAGSVLTSEEWDDPLPLPITGTAPPSRGPYYVIQTKPYDDDEPAKYFGSTGPDGKHVAGLFDQLDRADYVILSSNRVYASATRLPMRYPALIRYYRALFDGTLGFERVADITSYPSMFSIAIPDQSAEEAFSVYDHPRVLIFKKTPGYSRANAERLITDGMAWSEVYKLPTLRVGQTPTALRLTEAQWPAYRAAGTWSALFGPASLANQVPWLVWLLAIEVLGLACYPLLFCLLPGLPDRGFTLAKTLGLVLVAYAAWLLGSLKTSGGALLPFSPSSVWLCAGLLIAAGAIAGWRVRRELLAFVRRRFVALAVAEEIFLLAWLAFLVVRALNPDLWHPARGGERPFDLAYLTAVVKSPAFPPYDPWFAGGYVNQPYFGLMIVGSLIHLTGVIPTTAYNLAVPTLFALAALGAWGVGYNLLAPRKAFRLGRGRRLRHELRAAIAGGAVMILVALAGNLNNAFWLLGGYAAQNASRPEWLYWDAVHFNRIPPEASTVNEFPFYTFLFGELQPQMLALPLALAALGLMVALLKANNKRGKSAWYLTPLTSCLLLLALVVGALRATNGWDYPSYLALSIATLGLAALARRRSAGRVGALTLWASASLGLAALSYGLFLPFSQSYAAAVGLRLWREAGTSAIELLSMDGLWMVVLLSAGGLLYRRARTFGWRAAALALVALGLAALAILADAGALWVVVPLAALAAELVVGLACRTGPKLAARLSPAAQLPIVWALAGLIVTLAGELFVGSSDATRDSSARNFGLQSWLLFGCASGPALVWLWRVVMPTHLPARPIRRAAGWAWRAGALLAIATALVYPITATPARVADRFDARVGPTLDGMAFMRSGAWMENGQVFPLAEDADAIAWMRANIAGSPIILEAQTDPYRWAGRVSAYTGLPTLLGWPWHELRQRNIALAGRVLDSRAKLIAQLYSAGLAGDTLRTLQLYGVEYVYVGQLERALYPAAGLAMYDALARSGVIQIAYRSGGTVIYHVPPSGQTPAVVASTAGAVP